VLWTHTAAKTPRGNAEWVEQVDRASTAPIVVSAKDVALKMRIDYLRGLKDQTTRNLDAVCKLCKMFEQPVLDVDSFIREAAGEISKLFSIDAVAVGVRDPKDKLYKYRVVIGLDEETAESYRNLRYTREEILDPTTYPNYEISERTRIFLSEDHPYAKGEEFTYRRPGMIGMKRYTVTDSLEADYLDSFFYDSSGEILGYVEVSGTKMKKLPDTTTIKWIELISSLIGAAVRRSQQN
jgi:hypothetical protein